MSAAKKPTAIEKRAQNPKALAPFALHNLNHKLPLVFPRDPDLPPSPKPRYRSAYRYLGFADLNEETIETFSPFEIAVRLFDYSQLETRPKRAACEHRAGSITHSSAQMGLSNAWVTHPAANYCAQDDSSPHQLEATRVFGRISRTTPGSPHLRALGQGARTFSPGEHALAEHLPAAAEHLP